MKVSGGAGSVGRKIAQVGGDLVAGRLADTQVSGVSLLVRLWLEPIDDAHEGSVLRGYVRNLLDGREQYFESLDELQAYLFVEDLAGDDVPEPLLPAAKATRRSGSGRRDDERRKGSMAVLGPAPATTKEE